MSDESCDECGADDCELFWMPQQCGWWCEACKDHHDQKWTPVLGQEE